MSTFISPVRNSDDMKACVVDRISSSNYELRHDITEQNKLEPVPHLRNVTKKCLLCSLEVRGQGYKLRDIT